MILFHILQNQPLKKGKFTILAIISSSDAYKILIVF